MIIKVFTNSSCHWCDKLKAYLKEHNLEFTEINVSTDAEARRHLTEDLGIRSVPTMEVDGKVVVGYNPVELKIIFG